MHLSDSYQIKRDSTEIGWRKCGPLIAGNARQRSEKLLSKKGLGKTAGAQGGDRAVYHITKYRRGHVWERIEKKGTSALLFDDVARWLRSLRKKRKLEKRQYRLRRGCYKEEAKRHKTVYHNWKKCSEGKTRAPMEEKVVVKEV